MIDVRLEGMLQPLLDRGLSPQRLVAAEPRCAGALAELRARVESGELGFLDVGGADVAPIAAEAQRLSALAQDLLVLGIGGSSLGGQLLVSALARPEARRRVHFVDNVDPATLSEVLGQLRPAGTAALVITKSGGTIETLAQLLCVRDWLQRALGPAEMRTRLSFVTDPQRGTLREIARAEGIACLDVPPNVGGRFSALTPVGLLPAAFAGVDAGAVLRGARSMRASVLEGGLSANPAARLATASVLAHEELGSGCVVVMPYCDRLRLFSSWFVQLWAESLGKRLDRRGNEVRRGQTAVAAVGATDQHAQLQLFVEGPRDKIMFLIGVEASPRFEIPAELVHYPDMRPLMGNSLGDLLAAERRATRAALLEAGVPVVDVNLGRLTEASLGALILLWEAACALAGLMQDIDPFDQPGVELGKRMALGLLGHPKHKDAAAVVAGRERVKG